MYFITVFNNLHTREKYHEIDTDLKGTKTLVDVMMLCWSAYLTQTTTCSQIFIEKLLINTWELMECLFICF